jgi:hypothetical protein
MLQISPIPKCMKPGCLARPTRVPVLCVPRKGIPLAMQSPIKATIDIPLCRKHIGEPTVGELLTDNMKRLFVMQTVVNRSNPPDFDKAWIESVTMNDPRYLDALRQKRERGQL